MIIAMNRQGVLAEGEASKTIARSLLSPSLLARLMRDNRERDLPHTVWLRAPLRTCG